MANSKTKIIKDTEGNEIVMERVDKTVMDMMDEKPSSRWDPEYWHTSYDKLFEELTNSGLQIKSLSELMLAGISGITYGQVGRREYEEKGEVQYLQVSNIRITGIDIYKKYARIKENSYNDPERSRLKELDLILINGGVGSLGRACLVVNMGNKKFNISQDIDRIRFQEPSMGFYITTFLNSKYGQRQLKRYTKGVSGQTKIGFDHVRSIKVPILSDGVSKNIESEYKKMSSYHDKAMEAKKKGNEKEYKKNIEIAEKMLKDLISRTEAVILGERDDVV